MAANAAKAVVVREAGRDGQAMKFCRICKQDRTGDKFCTVCGTAFAPGPSTDTFAIQKPRTEPPRQAAETVAGQPASGQAYAEAQFSGASAWAPTDSPQPSWGQRGGNQPGLDQAAATRVYYPGPGGPSQPQPGQHTPPGQYPAQGSYTPDPYMPPDQYPVPGLGPQQPGSGRRRSAILASVAAVVVLGAGTGAYALVSSLHHGTSTTPPSGPTAVGTATSAATTPDQTTPTTPSSPGPGTVTLSQAAASSPAATRVQNLLGHYFDAINTRNYTEYSSTLDATMRANSPQSRFDHGYATTTDSSVVVNSITSNGNGTLTANVSFTSTQDPSDSVDHSPCNKWTLNLPLVAQDSGYVISTPPSDYATYTDC
jgi:hypothetical protein